MKRKVAFFVLLFFSLTMFASTTTDDTVKNKLIGPLKDLSGYYKTQAKFSVDRRLGLMKPQREQKDGTGKWYIDENGEKKQIFPILREALILDEVQESWGNPDFDVLSCLIRYSGDPDDIASDLVKILSKVRMEGDGEEYLVSAEFAATELNRLAALPQVQVISPALRNSENNDQGTFWTGASLIRKQEGNRFTRGYTGEGVIVGVIDTGIDWTHEDFIDPLTGETRILYLWDSEVDTPGKSPADVFGGILSGLTDGTVWTKAEIDAGSCTSTDTNGHGTHVTGSAAGNGSATGKYAGMAPNADIIFVKGINDAGNDGALFIYELARLLGKSCTVNMSYGPSYPFHYMSLWPDRYPADNTSIAAQFFYIINYMYGPGHIPVKSAGNNGHWNTYTGSTPKATSGYHIQGQLSGSQSVSHTMTWANWPYYWVSWGYGPPSANDFPKARIGIWYTGPISITLVSPDGHAIGPVVHGTSGSVSDLVAHDGKVNYELNNPLAYNGCYYGILELQYDEDPVASPIQGDWQIIVRAAGSAGTVSYDMWTADWDVYFDTEYLMPNAAIYNKFTGNYSHSKYIIHEGASDYLITVGNFCTRDNWTDVDGNHWSYVKKPIVGQINDSSSPGPARDGRMKPDIAAPGSIIVSAWSKDCSYGDLYKPDASHMTMSGTSMSSPHVTGGVALMLQKNRNYTVPSLRSTIGRWAHHDWFTDTGSANAWGYGKFNLRPLNSAPVAVITVDKTEIVLDDMEYTVNFDGSGSSDPEGFDLTYTFSYEALPLDDGAAPSAETFTSSGSTAVLEVDPNVEGRYRASLKVNDGLADSETVWSSYVETRFYPILPPVNLTVTRTENDLILFKEYINTVTWEANPENKSKVDHYILYVKEKGADDSTYIQLDTYLPTATLKYEKKGLTKDELYTYKVVAVNMRGVVSDPVVAGN